MLELASNKIVETTVEKPNVFISYARSDGADLAEELVSGLELASFRPFLDRHDIAAAEDWEARLGALILSADTIVFILSPAAVRSERCAWEVERAAQLGKRLIPVQGIPVPESEVPEQLRRLNYIFFRQGQSFARPLRELVTALRQDVEWIREHTRLSEAAVRWQVRGSGTEAAEDLLLRGVELANAQTWAAHRRDDAPAITPLLRAFLTASEAGAEVRAQQERDRLAERERLVAEREAAQRDIASSQEKIELAQRSVRQVQRRWASVLVIVTVLVVLGTGAGLWQLLDFWRTIMVARSGFIAGMVDRETGEGDHVTAMLLGLEALPDSNSESIRRRRLPLEMTAVNALYGAWRNWRTEWGERATLAGPMVGHTGPISVVVFSPDRTRVLVGSWDTVRLCDAASGKPIATLPLHTDPRHDFLAFAFSPDGKRILAATWGNETPVLWDATSGEPIATLTGHTASTHAVAFSPDLTRALTGSFDNTARVWDAASGKAIATLAGHTGAVQAVAFSPDGTQVLTGSEDNTARLWDAATGKPIATLAGHTGHVWAVAFSPDGTRVLTGSDDNTARLWDAASGKPIATFAGHTDRVSAVAFSPDGTRVLTGSDDNTTRLWDAASGKLIATLAGHTGAIRAVAFSVDGTRILTSAGETERLWDADTGKPFATLAGHTGPVQAVAFSPDGTRVLTGSDDHTARLWEAASGKPIATFAGHTDPVEAVAFSPDGTRILAGNSPGCGTSPPASRSQFSISKPPPSPSRPTAGASLPATRTPTPQSPSTRRGSGTPPLPS